MVCDRTGIVVWDDQIKTEWNGLKVWEKVYEDRHPQDLLRAKRENIAVQNARPRPIDAFIGPLITELAQNHAAGSTSIEVEDTARFRSDDIVLFYLSDDDMFRATVVSITDSNTMVITPALKNSALSGSLVVNETAVAQGDIG
jgi:hypothetical protein